MPNHDGTGPLGNSPMSGRKRGFCGKKNVNSTNQSESNSNEVVYGVGKGGVPRGCGNGNKFGGGKNRVNENK